MIRSLALLALLAVPLLALGQDVPPTVSFKTEKAAYKAGEDIKGTVTVTFAPGLHGYQNPPVPKDVLPVTVKPGDGTLLKSVSYPKGFMAEFAGIEAMFYAGTVDIPVVIAAPKGSGKVGLNLGLFYQQCDEGACYPPATIPVSAEVTIEKAATPTVGSESFVGVPRVTPWEPTIALTMPNGAVRSGEAFTGAITIDLPQGIFVIPSSLKVEVEEPLRITSVAIPEGRPHQINDRLFQVVSGVVRIPITFQAITEPTKVVGKVHFEYEFRDDKGPMGPLKRMLNLVVEVLPREARTDPGSTSDLSGGLNPSGKATSTGDTGLLGFLNNALEKGNWALIIPAALLTGLALCFTPCVFPMIPVTVSFFSNQDGVKSGAGRFGLGLFYALGIAGTYGAVGGISAAAGGAVGELFTKPWFVIALALFLIALALSMFDVYEIRLPGFIQKNLKGRSGPVGALIMGLLMGFAAAPCAGALVGAVAVKVAEIGSIPTGLGMFGLIGLGMGLPFMALATASAGAKKIPRSGGWLKTTKAVLGLLVLYFAFDYLFKGFGLRTGAENTNTAWLVVFGAFIAYLLFFDKSEPSRAVTTIKGLAVAGIGVFMGMTYAGMNATPVLNWVPYNEQTFQQAVASGKPIMIDGKADWCLQCIEIEHGVFQTPDGVVALKDVYLMTIDWSTGVDEGYKAMTAKRFNIKGLPHIVFMKPGGKDEFAVKDIKSVEELKGHLRRAGAKL